MLEVMTEKKKLLGNLKCNLGSRTLHLELSFSRYEIRTTRYDIRGLDDNKGQGVKIRR